MKKEELLIYYDGKLSETEQHFVEPLKKLSKFSHICEMSLKNQIYLASYGIHVP